MQLSDLNKLTSLTKLTPTTGIIVAVAVVIAVASHFYYKSKPNPVEEVAESIIKYETGIDIDSIFPDDSKTNDSTKT